MAQIGSRFNPLHVANAADDASEHLRSPFVPREPVGADHACFGYVVAGWIFKELQCFAVETQNAGLAKGFRRGDDQDVIGKILINQGRRHARTPFAKDPCQSAPAKEFQGSPKIDAPARIARRQDNLHMRLAQERGFVFSGSKSGNDQCWDLSRRRGKLALKGAGTDRCRGRPAKACDARNLEA